MIAFTVPGLAAPGGSKRAYVIRGRAVVTPANPTRERQWRAVVQVAARTAYSGAPLTGPLRMELRFVMPRPASHLGARGLRRSAPRVPATRPDLSKLVRALEDALTGIVWRDDAQVVEQWACKTYGDSPQVDVQVWRVEDETP